MIQLNKIGVSILASMGLAVPLFLALPGSTAMAEVVLSCEADAITDLSCPADEDQTYVLTFDATVDGPSGTFGPDGEYGNGEFLDADGDGIADLSTQITLTFYQAYEITDAGNPYTVWIFTADIEVLMDTVFTGGADDGQDLVTDARVSAFGFNTGGFCATAVTESGCEGEGTNFDDELAGVGAENGEFDTRVVGENDWIFDDVNPYNDPDWVDNSGLVATDLVSDVFDSDTSGAFPQTFGDVDVCFLITTNCHGGGGGGVSGGDTGSFTFVLAFAGDLMSNPSIALSRFGVRYQSVTSTWSGYNWDGESGVGVRIPEPGSLTIMGMGLLGLCIVRRRRQKNAAKEISN